MTTPVPLRDVILAEIGAAATPDALEAVRVRALGKAGRVTAMMKTLGTMSAADRQLLGPVYNATRDEIAAAIAARKAALDADALAARLRAERQDMTLPVAPSPRGRIHPVSQTLDELTEIFADLDFAVATGPEIEDEWHNFTALNIAEDHPARAMHDTFYFRTGADGARMLLRTHTSPVQIRTMLSQKPPIRIIAPGRVYRSDSDATHTPMFHQIEGLVIDRGIHMGHLKWTIETFLKAFFEAEQIALRFFPSFFPFTEPSADVQVGYAIEDGVLRIGGTGKWLEVMGAGMVHPRVLTACGLDPAEWSGFAFGTGVDRLAMLKYGIADLRAMFDGDLRWLDHYGFDPLQVPTLSGGVGA